MVFKRLIGLVFAGSLSFSAAAADIVVRIAPPRAEIERRAPPPSRNYVWVSGYHRWDGNAYAWTPGRWEQPPRRHAHWVAHRWRHHRGGWVLVEGHWR
ncbi:MAG: hypothetical protein LAP39_29360 [Acidobacteriia bacterium]|nr:hypothetical protein [Terriglobia bacterium]